jgi:hypothetical protein
MRVYMTLSMETQFQQMMLEYILCVVSIQIPIHGDLI